LSRYYQVAGLKPGYEIAEDARALRVDLSSALLRPFAYNDEDILSTQRKGEYIWASGGGTWLLNHRYLPIVQRARHAMVNPGKFSLFTGRADNTEEMLQPGLLVRELFEELVLFTEHRLCRPYCKKFREIINQVYTGLESNLGLDIAAAMPLHLEYLLCAPRIVSVANQGGRQEDALDYHVNSNGEVNILFVFTGYADIDKLQAMDGEYNLVNGKAVRTNRSIYLYDLYTGMGRDITIGHRVSEPVLISLDNMNEHLHHLVNKIKVRLASGSPFGRAAASQEQLKS
jgi:hypothetical protein